MATQGNTLAGQVGRREYVLILFALAMGGFAIGTSEFATMGLMPNIARGLSISEPQVGHLISAYALGVVIGAPVLAILGARLRRKPMAVSLMAFYALGNLASALAPNYAVALVCRFVAGLPHGAYFGVAALVAASVSRPDQRGAAVSRVMMGLALAVLLGNPLASWLGEVWGWRSVYLLVTLVAAATVVLVALLLPGDRCEPPHEPLREIRAFNRSQVWLALGIGSVGFAGMFCVFSYLVPTLTEVTGAGVGWVPVALGAFGVGSILGTLFGGWLYDRIGFRSVFWVLLWSTMVLLLFPLSAGSLWSLLPAVVALGTMGALGPALQMRLMDVSSDAQTLAAASHHAAFNVANALGPWLGGLAITAGMGWTSTGYVGAATAVAGLLVYAWARQDESRLRRLAAQAD
ncbi:MFS transporter [Stenotrophomonas sp. MMGLT7]|uniref:MFS transporter n=1 Tax=Stenotrophomonas sp. MMGLT7 TaxID=2901227 RepID=UPI001E2F8ED9|nr:MFS transporter [Stenotrophomonas sp. MMGLT7]MCD7097373.1 MFS transporter [Stenotrophomonas sp. MMGLT7]